MIIILIFPYSLISPLTTILRSLTTKIKHLAEKGDNFSYSLLISSGSITKFCN